MALNDNGEISKYRVNNLNVGQDSQEEGNLSMGIVTISILTYNP